MRMSNELTGMVVDCTNSAIERILGTDGPLLSFVAIEAGDGTRGTKDYPEGTSEQDLVQVASIRGVQRCVLVTSGTMQGSDGPIPILLLHAAERGDPTGLVLAQRFRPVTSPRFAELVGQIDAVQTRDNWFQHAGFELSEDPRHHAALLQESFARFGRRWVGAAFQDDDPQVSMVELSAVHGEPDAQGSFQYLHAGTGTRILCECEYTHNTFRPTRFMQIDEQGGQTPLTGELGTRLLQAYEQ